MDTIQEAMAKRESTETKEPVVDSSVEPVVNNNSTENDTITSEEDIITKVSKLNSKVETKEDPVNPTETKFNVNDIENITDPKAKEYAQNAYKSLEKGYQKKFQELAAERKALETEKLSINTYTPERIASLLNNEEFVKASQQYMQLQNPVDSEISDDEWSNLSDKEKAEIRNMKKQLDDMTRQNQRIQFQSQMDKQNSELSQKYANYDADKVTALWQDMASGKVAATNEHIWKVIDYEPAILRAYNLGKEGRQLDINDKQQVSTIDTTASRTTEATGDNVRKEGESPVEFLKRRMLTNLQNKPKT